MSYYSEKHQKTCSRNLTKKLFHQIIGLCKWHLEKNDKAQFLDYREQVALKMLIDTCETTLEDWPSCAPKEATDEVC